MTFKIIRSKRDYTTALELLIKSYEDTHYPIEIPDPLAAIQYRMEQQGLSKQELASILGYKSRVTDLFNGHRKLNLSMIRKLHAHLNISYDTLVKEY
jgi:HTH-type transcriptional regulator / antitoxin HigA